jgi:hypothetical protein
MGLINWDDHVLQVVLNAANDEESPEIQSGHTQLTKGALINLLDQCFLASIAQNEGRPVRFAMSFSDPATQLGPTHANPHRAVRVGPKPLSAALITKVAPALERVNVMHVHQHPESEKASLWGIGHSFFSMLLIIAQQPGQLKLVVRGRPLAATFNGRLVLLSSEAVDMVLRLFDPTFVAGVPHLLDRTTFEDGVRIILDAAREHGNGATIVVSPYLKNAPQLPLTSGPIPLKEPDERLPLMEALHNVISKGKPEDPAYHRQRALITEPQFQHVCRQIGKLTSVDGALWLDAALRVLQFGCKLTAKDPRLEVAVFQPYVAPEACTKLEDLGGTRHQSAAQFVAQDPTQLSVVFVVSHDGPITLFRRGDQGVFALKHIEAIL